MCSYLTEVSPAVPWRSRWAAAARGPPSCAPHPQLWATLRRPQRSEPRSRIRTGGWSPSSQSRSPTRSSQATAWWTPPPALSTCSVHESAEKDPGLRTSLTPHGQKCPTRRPLTWQKQLGTPRSRLGGCGPPGGNTARSSRRLEEWRPRCRWYKASRRSATAPGKRRLDVATKHMMGCSLKPPEGGKRVKWL